MDPERLVELLREERNLGKIIRFSARKRLKDENVAEHCFHVSFYCMVLADIEKEMGNEVDVEKLLRASLLHDLEEALTGDIIHDFKHSDEKLTREIERIGLQFYKDLMEHLPEKTAEKYTHMWKNAKNPDTIEGKILHAADRLDALIYSMDEYSMGNTNFESVVKKIRKDLEKIGLESIKLLLEEIDVE